MAPGANRFGDVWEIMQEQRNDHPAPFPVELIYRIISSTTANIILDPFMGSGTTAVVAAGLGRNYIGIEKSKKYCDSAEKRLENNKILSEVEKYRQEEIFDKLAGTSNYNKLKNNIKNEHQPESLF